MNTARNRRERPDRQHEEKTPNRIKTKPCSPQTLRSELSGASIPELVQMLRERKNRQPTDLTSKMKQREFEEKQAEMDRKFPLRKYGNSFAHNPEGKKAADELLRREVDDNCLDEIRGMLADSRYEVRYTASYALGQLRDMQSVESLCRVAEKDESVVVAKEAVIALGKIASANAVKTLSEIACNDLSELYDEVCREIAGCEKKLPNLKRTHLLLGNKISHFEKDINECQRNGDNAGAEAAEKMKADCEQKLDSVAGEIKSMNEHLPGMYEERVRLRVKSRTQEMAVDALERIAGQDPSCRDLVLGVLRTVGRQESLLGRKADEAVDRMQEEGGSQVVRIIN